MEAKAKERAELQARIQKLGAERAHYLLKQHKEQVGAKTLDTALVEALAIQAKAKGFAAP